MMRFSGRCGLQRRLSQYSFHGAQTNFQDLKSAEKLESGLTKNSKEKPLALSERLSGSTEFGQLNELRSIFFIIVGREPRESEILWMTGRIKQGASVHDLEKEIAVQMRKLISVSRRSFF